MMSEEKRIRTFICRQLDDAQDLSTLTLGILKTRYLAHADCQSLSPEIKRLIKRVVEEELVRMQDRDKEESEPLKKKDAARPYRNKRKREDEVVVNGRADGSRAKKSRRRSSSSENIDSVNKRGGREDKMKENHEETNEEEANDSEQEARVSKKEAKDSSEEDAMDSEEEAKDSEQEAKNSSEEVAKDRKKEATDSSEEDVKDSEEEAKDSSEEEAKDSSEEEAKDSSEQEAKDRKKEAKDRKKEARVSKKGATDSGDGTEEETDRSRKRKQTKTLPEDHSDDGKDGSDDGKDCSDGKDSDSDDDSENYEKPSGKVKKPTRSRAKRGWKTSEDKMSTSSRKVRGNQVESDGEEEEAGERNSNDSKEEEEREVKEKTDKAGQDSDSSSLPSLENELACGGGEAQRSKKTFGKMEERVSKRNKEEEKPVMRLKRYIALCGVKRNYKKLLGDCRSVRSMVAILKGELEELGVQGQATIGKCKRVRLKREEAQELADLDPSNIITTQGRPKRRGAWQEQHVRESPVYKCLVNSDSEDSPLDGRRRKRDWGNLMGIISDDGDSG